MEDIHQHRPLLFSLAYGILGEVQEAEDIVQDVFESCEGKLIVAFGIALRDATRGYVT